MKPLFRLLFLVALLGLIGLVLRQPETESTVNSAPLPLKRIEPLSEPVVLPVPDPTPRVPPADANPKLRPTAESLWQTPPREPAFARFHEWTTRYLAAPINDRTALEAEGLVLAQTRRAELKELIVTNPEHALDLAVPLALRQQLPDSVVELLEERLDGRGELALLAALPQPGQEGQHPTSWRTATVGDRTYRAHVYGRRLDEPTRRDVPLHGLAVDQEMAVDDNPLRILESVEAEAALATAAACAVDAAPIPRSALAVAADDGDGTPLILCCYNHGEVANQQLIDAESNSGSTVLTEDGLVRPSSAYTEGIKRLILIRVDFSDKVGEPFSNSRATNLVRSIDQFFRENSYGRAGFRALGDGSTITPTLRLPRTTTEYGTLDASKLREEARTAATRAGFALSNFDFDVICFRSVPGFGWAGLGYVGAPGSWVQDSFDETGGVFAHELGHNYGLNHANFWDTAGESVIGTKGNNVEYGDSFDTMGNATAGRRHFNVRNKVALNWLRLTEIQTAADSGTYRLYAHDTTNASGIRGLRAIKDSRTNYWFEYRARFADNRWMSNGIGVRRARSDNNRQSQLLDTTAGSPDGKNDSALVIGRTFSDLAAGIHVTPVQRVDSDPPAIDVVVFRGKFPENRRPTVSVASSLASVTVNSPVTLTATAADADGDALAYGWDFGDGNFGANARTVTNRWTTAGEYVVRCVVSDMKGGETSDYVVVRVGSPTTFRLSGKVERDNLPLEGVRVFVSNTRLTYTGSDGTYVLTGLTAGQYTVKALAEGLLFTRDGFSNPLTVSSHRTGINFIGALPGDLEFSTLVPAGAEWRYHDEGKDLGSLWRIASFDDTLWKRGPAQLGYGDDDVVTEIGYGPDANNKYITSYFRHEFFVEEAGRIINATLGVARDDGAVVYLNGREVFRSNMPPGTITSRTLASSTVGSEDESTYFEAELAGTSFLEGRNVLAVEVHQAAADSSDVSFNLRLEALLAPASGVGLFPTLVPEITPQGVRVSWPTAFTGYSLQSRLDFQTDEDWAPIDVPIETIGDKRSVLLPLNDSQRFLRLNR